MYNTKQLSLFCSLKFAIHVRLGNTMVKECDHMEPYVDKRIQRSVKALKEAFLTCLEQKPFQEITISEIVRLANYNRGTFYAHFESKEHLLQSLIDETLKNMLKEIQVPYEHLQQVDMRALDANSITVFQYFLNNKRLFRILLSTHIQVDMRHQIGLAIEELFIQQYEYELTSSNVDIKWLYVYRAHGLAAMIIRWIEEDFSTPAQEMAEQVLQLMTLVTYTFKPKVII